MHTLIKASVPGLLLAMASGCATQSGYVQKIPQSKMDEYLADKPAVARQHYRNVLEEGERNRVLNEMRTALMAFELGELDVARTGFDSVLDSIETVYSNNASAKKARSKFRAEKTKEFKGEGYERAMAYYYRGLLYLAEDDYENARASFLSAQLQDGFAEQEDYASDFASMEWLAGWATQCRGKSIGLAASSQRLANEYFNNAKRINKWLTVPTSSDNILLIAETGTAPKKVSSPKGEEYLTYAPGITARAPTFTWASATVPLVSAESLYWQASTRGGRQVDVVNAGKAEFKQSAADTAAAAASVADASISVASVLLDAQSLTGYSEDLMNATGVAALGGIFGSLVSGVSSSVSKATKPEADLRYWDNLPSQLHFGALNAYSIPASINYTAQNGEQASVDLMGGTDGCALGWVRTHSALDVPPVHINAR